MLCPWSGLWGRPQLPRALAEQRGGEADSFTSCLCDALWGDNGDMLLLQNQLPLHSWGTVQHASLKAESSGFSLTLFFSHLLVPHLLFLFFIKLIKREPGKKPDRKPLAYLSTTEGAWALLSCPTVGAASGSGSGRERGASWKRGSSKEMEGGKQRPFSKSRAKAQNARP